MKITNLDAVKDYIADNGIFIFISPDWLQASVADVHGLDLVAMENNPDDEGWLDVNDAVRSELDEYDDFKSLYQYVLCEGMDIKNTKIFIAEMDEYLSDADMAILKKSVA